MLIASLAVLFIGVSKSGFGGGIGILGTPLFIIIMPGSMALSVMLPILLTCDAFTVRQFPKTWHRESFRALFPWNFTGLFLGLAALVLISRQGLKADLWIRLVVGLVVFAFPLIAILGKKRSTTVAAPPPLWLSAATGLLCGVTTMIAHAAGVILNLYLLRVKMSPQEFVGTTGRFYLTFNSLKIPFYIAATFLAHKAFLTPHNAFYCLWLLPLCPLGVAMGAWLNRRFTTRRFETAVRVLLVVSGAFMSWDSGARLFRS